MDSSLVRTHTDNHVMHITIDRQDKLNALNRPMVSELSRAFETAESDPQTRCVVLTGAGERAFVAGADIAEIQALEAMQARAFLAIGNGLMNRIEGLGKPVIAAITGFALGGGCELALACHFRIAADTAQLGLPEVGLGLIPGYGGTQRLPRLIGRGRALEMMLTGQIITAEQALSWGLVNQVVAAEDLAPTVDKLASRLARSAPLAMAAIMRAVTEGSGLALAEGLELESSQFAELLQSQDMHEGTSAFLEKRRPEFKGN